MKFYPVKKGGWGGGKSFSHTEGGHKSFRVFLTQELKVLMGHKEFLPFERSGERVRKVLPCLEGGGWGRKMFRTRDFPILLLPLPIMNDRSLTDCNIPAKTCATLMSTWQCL